MSACATRLMRTFSFVATAERDCSCCCMNWNTLILQATNGDDIYSIFPLISILAYADLLFESAKGIGNFSVICDDFIRLFVKISFGEY